MKPWVVLLVAASVFSGIAAAPARELTFEQRVAAQEAVEQVYWNHRIWPKENAGAKPPLSSVMPGEAIRAKVSDYLRKSNAIETWWQRSITAAQLQAEVDRMSDRSRDPDLLRELYTALGNDPFVIAETLGRQTLVDRLSRSWYAFDDRFHGALKQRVEEALDRSPSATPLKSLGGDYAEQRFVRRGDAGQVLAHQRADAIELTDEDWRAWRESVARRFGTKANAIPLRRVSALQEDADSFSVSSVLSAGSDEMVVASVVWPKRSFDDWWSQESVRTSPAISAVGERYSVRAPSSGECVNDTWELRTYAPSGRSAHTAVWTGSEMIVWGGFNGLTYTNTGARYNPSTDTWTATSTGSSVPSARGSHAAVWTGSEMVVWGGGNSITDVYVNTGARYNPATDVWKATALNANTPSPRRSNTAAWDGTRMIVWGGYDGGNLNTGGRYEPSTDQWSATFSGAGTPSARSGHSAVWSGSQMIVWGGYNGAYQLTGSRYNPTSDTWTATSIGAGVPAARSGHTAVWTGSEMIVWGGANTINLNSGARYNPTTNSWTATAASALAARSGHTAVWTGSEMIVWGGSGSSTSLNTGARYNPAANSWTATAASVVTARYSHAAVWTGSEMIVWGGYDTAYNNTGGRYSPATNSWLPTSLGVNVPSTRQGHTAVWTGTEMIVWGGNNLSTSLNTGGRYQLATDSWTPTSLGANAPAARQSHTAVWTGTEMIVWGGQGGAQRFATGGRYNPASNSWTATSVLAGVPAKRCFHTAVWTGTEMIVWGGSDASLYLNSGGRYNPASDSWLSTSIGANNPSVRDTHTAVWTGTEVIVWGGYDGGELNTGGRYSPASDTWAATVLGLDVPSGRDSHTAVWTGREMIVWGGYDSGTTKSGSRYDPVLDSWLETSTGQNSPSARDYHTAIWTGAEMIVWGGNPGNGWLNTGGRFDPDHNLWTSTSTGANVPTPRAFHQAVWTGERMLVWGGTPIDVNLGIYCVSSCVAPSTFFRDMDGDGFGNAGSTAQACTGIPPGYVVDSTDCDDVNAAIHPGATESCNGVDDDCNSVTDDGGGNALCGDGNGCTSDVCGGAAGCSHANVSGPCDDGDACTTGDACNGATCLGVPLPTPEDVSGVFASKSITTATFTWEAISVATHYDVLRGTLSVWPVGSVPASEICLGDDVLGTSLSDTLVPAAGQGYWYLVRAANSCFVGSYGSEESHGVPTVPETSSTCP